MAPLFRRCQAAPLNLTVAGIAVATAVGTADPSPIGQILAEASVSGQKFTFERL